ncbi:hypothetical protein GWO43_12815 [candidate division KSB1 bacterium]|nr:hypothetical protein [candidate division KSB1 bacterium]NIR71306.1 hypothetical protein [candidate division KSB1 bacterium]NIS24534.1 hypothetical protein [candidate division KSB1 bacterium]NIT71741.1 hypothetical protein [candidate division KSB1 bacterium]NIU25143.1 hypothetical protein [candidate division KSB1 bacterium]
MARRFALFSWQNQRSSSQKLNLFLYIAGVLSCFQHCLPNAYGQVCWSPRPVTSCKIFPFADIGVTYRLTPALNVESMELRDNRILRVTDSLDQEFYITSDFGFMRKLNNDYALGLSHFLGLVEGGFRGGLKLSLKKWFGTEKSIDISPGIIIWDVVSGYDAPRFTASLDLRLKEWVSIGAILEYMNPQTFDSISHKGTGAKGKIDGGFMLFGGLKIGSRPGFVLSAAGLFVGLIYGVGFLSGGID